MPIQKPLFILVLLLFLAACGSAPKRTAMPLPPSTNQDVQAEPEYSPDYYLDQAELAYQRSGDLAQRNQWLLKSAEAYQFAGQCHQTRKILYLLDPELFGNAQRTESSLLQAECLIQANSGDSDSLMRLLDSMSMGIGFDERINLVRVTLYEQQGRWLDKAQALLDSNLDEVLQSTQIWNSVQKLPEQELQTALRDAGALYPWLHLTNMVRKQGHTQDTLAKSIQFFEMLNPGHVLTTHLPAEVQAALALTTTQFNRIAVLLPLSGRLANQGHAIKEGVLAAYYETALQDSESAIDLHFFDANRFDFEQNAEQLAQFDGVIGPLLRDKINELTRVLPANIPVLALNRVSNTGYSAENHYFFALAPEDEARQLADKVWSRGASKPILVADDANTTKRMTQAFLERWQTLAGSQAGKPQSAFFSDTKSMRLGVTQLLDVAQSRQRIKQIEDLLTPELHAVPRNRRDIDAIVLFANPEQTELLNPIIESSLSPFHNKELPVFASSRSYSLELNKNSLRDLKNLTFTDMPWMLPEHQWPQLQGQMDTLWPNRNDTLRRLFALGYDSFTLLPNVARMKTLPQLSVNGLTGQLSVAQNGVILRKLPYGYINNDEVTLVAMD